MCVNLYPFERTAARRGVDDAEVIENIDIGGPTMIRAAAKNYEFAAVVVRPESYDAVLDELREGERRLSLATRESLAGEAFAYTARYDTAIARWFAEKQEEFPAFHVRAFEKVLDLPYGENPHQRAAYYAQVGARMHVLSMVKQHGGKDLSFNNLLDLNAGRLLVSEFQVPACAIIKHNNPCGVALGESAPDAYRRAFAGDPLSAFGGVICLNRAVDRELAEAIVDQFAELVFAPGLRRGRARDPVEQAQHAGARGQRAPHDERVRAGHQARHRRAARAGPRHGPGGALGDAGRDRAPSQRGRVGRDAVRLEGVQARALERDRARARPRDGGDRGRPDEPRGLRAPGRSRSRRPSRSQGAAMASDAFFPFADGPQLAIDAGVTAIIQPGGSRRDHEVVEAADEAGIAMVFTRRRHFRH